MRNYVILALVVVFGAAAQAGPTLFTVDSRKLPRSSSRRNTDPRDSKVVIADVVVSPVVSTVEKKEVKEVIVLDSVVPAKTANRDSTFTTKPSSRKKIKKWSEEVTSQTCPEQPGDGLPTMPQVIPVISDTGTIDNGTGDGWCVIPAPGAVLLGSIGIGLVGWLRRRAALL